MNTGNNNGGNNGDNHNGNTPASADNDQTAGQVAAGSEPTAGTAPTEATSTIAAAVAETVTVQMGGPIKGTFTGPKGAKLKEIVTDERVGNYKFAELTSGKPVSLDRVINENLALTSSEKAAGA